MLISGLQSCVQVLGQSTGRTVLVRGSMQLKCSGFNDVFLNFKAKSVNGLDAGNGDVRL